MRAVSYLAATLGVSVAILNGQPSVAQNFTPQILDSIVVTASLRAEERQDLPATVDVINADQLEAWQVTNVAEALESLAGMTVVQQGSPGQLTSLFVRGTDSNQTLVLWNGVELNDPFFGGFNWAFLPTDGVERIEVSRGPFSALYGSDAVGGVVNVVSGTQDGGVFRLEGGENGYLRAGLSAGTKFGEVDVGVTGHVRRGDGEFANDFFDGQEVVARADWHWTADRQVGILVRTNDSESGIPFSSGQPSLERRVAWQEHEVAIPIRIVTEGWQLEAQLSSVVYASEFRDPQDLFGFTESDTESSSRRARAVVSLDLSDRGWLALGAEHERLEVDSRSTFGTHLAGDSQSTEAVFGQLFYKAGRARIDLGLRVDDNSAYGSATSPKLGLVYRLTQNTRLRAAYGEAFRAPSIGELFFPGSGNPDLQPERSETVEVGVEHAAGPWSLSLTGFENRQTDLIDFDFITFRNINVGRARGQGVETALEFAGAKLGVRTSFSLVEAEDQTTGQALLRRPKESGSLSVTLRPGDWLLSALLNYVGDRTDVDPVTFVSAENPGYSVLDLAAHWKREGFWQPYARVENALDEAYEPALGFPAPDRTWVGGLRFDF